MNEGPDELAADDSIMEDSIFCRMDEGSDELAADDSIVLKTQFL
jgi:hypothetical protein